MRLIDLDPRWLIKDGRRIGFVFKSPLEGMRTGTNHSQTLLTCFFAPTPDDAQHEAVVAAVGDVAEQGTQSCSETSGWSCTPSAETATFENISIALPFNAGPNGWRGIITNGEIIGGI
jgi:hypothetical protein